MLRVHYDRKLPWPLEDVLSQYFDLEHIAHVHPRTIGRYELVETDGPRVRYRHHWPDGRSTSLVEQEWHPPDRINFRYLEGRHRGVELDTRFHATEDGTHIEDEYRIPGLPDWGWLRVLATPWVHREVNRIWDEDLAAGLPRGGWSGVPGVEQPAPRTPEVPPLDSIEVGRLDTLPDGVPVIREAEGVRVLLLRRCDAVHALDPRCPHAGGPLQEGALREDAIVCPWHGKRYRFSDGKPCGEAGGVAARAYMCEVEGGLVHVRLRGSPVP